MRKRKCGKALRELVRSFWLSISELTRALERAEKKRERLEFSNRVLLSPISGSDKMNESSRTLYDEIRYPARSFEYTHPNRLGTIAALYGMTPAPIPNCRVLELGCGVGGNIIPMAYQNPKSQFVGIDLSGDAVSVGGKGSMHSSSRIFRCVISTFSRSAINSAASTTSSRTAFTRGFPPMSGRRFLRSRNNS